MAESLAHRWGQIIGDGFEMFVRNVLGEVAKRHGLYLDFKKPRATRGGQGKVTWQDGYGNKHDLDYVLERGGTEETLGVPIAFIESAWRRYTKHSKNKVQEIEAAVMPIALTFSRHQPFCGAVLGGEFTPNSMRQLKSKGFGVLHIPYDSILAAFKEKKHQDEAEIQKLKEVLRRMEEDSRDTKQELDRTLQENSELIAKSEYISSQVKKVQFLC